MSFKKPTVKIIVSFLSVILLVGIISFALGNSIPTTNYYLETPLPIADYYIGQYSNASYFAINGSNWDNFVVGTAPVVKDAVLASLPSSGATGYSAVPVTIKFAPGDYGALVLTRGHIKLIGDTMFSPYWNTTMCPHFSKITIDTAYGSVTDIEFDGFDTNMLNFSSHDSRTITNVVYKNMRITSDATVNGEGVVFGGDDTGGIYRIYFQYSHFQDGGQSARKGFFSFCTDNGGNGQLFLDHCTYYTGGAGYTRVFLAAEDDGSWSPEIGINELDMHCDDDGTHFTFYRNFAQTVEGGGLASLVVHDSWLELHSNSTLVYIEAQPEVNTGAIHVNFHDNFLTSGNLTVIENLNDDWYYYGCSFSFCHNIFQQADGDSLVYLGIPAPDAGSGGYMYFQVNVESNRGLADYP